MFRLCIADVVSAESESDMLNNLNGQRELATILFTNLHRRQALVSYCHFDVSPVNYSDSVVTSLLVGEVAQNLAFSSILFSGDPQVNVSFNRKYIWNQNQLQHI